MIDGKKGDDTASGGKGKDRLIWSHGIDEFAGGAGKDIFEISKGKGHAIITDFKNNKDKIVLPNGSERLSIGNVKKDAYLYHGNDLMAIVEGAKNMLDVKGDTLI